ncbi:MAG: DNA (cytosine-5-)-methyltransferase [Bacteroidia bacterium]|nr:DNA (cytosine-5-)-methyltransferase [Bacteroidia bacterium]
MAKFTFIDLFAGIGGFRIALSNAGGTCLGFSEIAPDAINTYCRNYGEPESNNFGDITKLKTLPEHDFMTAGVPCQSWSIAGKKLGFDDDRGQLWNDTLYLLNKVRPKAFIFENVKGLADPRNSSALDYIMSRIREAGYYAEKYILNAYDYGVPQTRVRIYIIGFREEKYLSRFELPDTCPGAVRLSDILDGAVAQTHAPLPGNKARWSLSCNDQGFNDYFLFNDIRNGSTTIHTWDIEDTTEREKRICYLLLSNRRKRDYGPLDGNPLSAEHFKGLDPTITKEELDSLVDKGILKGVPYLYRIKVKDYEPSENEQLVLSFGRSDVLNIDQLKLQRVFRVRGIGIVDTIEELETKGIIECIESRYDFKHSRISAGLNGVNRIFLKSSKIYPTMVASDTNDYIATEDISAGTVEELREEFMEKIYRPHNYRQITKSEACRIQGFPDDFILPETRPRWMKLIGNSIAVSLVKRLAQSVVNTGVFDERDYKAPHRKVKHEEPVQGLLFDL